jgi:pseudouridine-5'-phosphate glycosidase
MSDDDPIVIADEVAEALFAGRGVVALETTLVSHGFPHPQGVEVARAAEDAVRATGAVPATIGVVDGLVRVGLDDDSLARFGERSAQVRKLGPRDIGICVAQEAMGATTVGATIVIARAAGIAVMATGGIGGVHRGYPNPPDVSADLGALARVEVLVVGAGVKSILDVPATCEMLETLGVPVLGWRTDTLPLFYTAKGGPPVAARVEAVAEAVAIAHAHWHLGGHGILLARPPDTSLEVESLIAPALDAAEAAGVHGQALTPFVLGWLHDNSDGRTLAANRDLIVANAGLAGEMAASLAADGLDEELFGDEVDEPLDGS